MVWARDRGRERHTEDEGIFLSLSDTRRGKGSFPEALETWQMTCWAPVCMLISICDCTQIQGGRHSGILRRPLVLADWGYFICWLADTQHSLSPCPLCLSQVTLTAAVVAPCSAALRGGQERDCSLVEPFEAQLIQSQRQLGVTSAYLLGQSPSSIWVSNAVEQREV